MSNRRKRHLHHSLVGIIVAGLLTVLPSAPATADCPTGVWNQDDAIAAAVDCGADVEVLSLEGETTQVWAHATGDLTARESLYPERVRDDAGNWVAADATLHTGPHGEITPIAASVDMWFPTGGAEPKVIARLGETELSVAMDGVTGVLPQPILDGSAATYQEITPGVDLQLTAEVTGFSHVLVLKTPEAAASPLVQNLTFTTTVERGGLREGAAETLEVFDPETGTVLISTGTATMWDSGVGASGLGREEQGTTGNGADNARSEPVDVTVDGNVVTLHPNTDFLGDPATTFPVYIDPPWSKSDSAYAILTDNEGSYYNSPHPPASGKEGYLKVGYTNEWKVFRARSLLKFPLSLKTLSGAKINSATLQVTQGWSWKPGDPDNACKGGSGVGLYQIPSFDKNTKWSTSWNAGGSGWQHELGVNREQRRWNTADCAAAQVEWNAVDAVRDAIGDRKESVHLGLKALDEGDLTEWRKYRTDASLYVRYNTYPSIDAASVGINHKGCATGADRPVVGDLLGDQRGPEITATIHDKDVTKDAQSLTTRMWWKPIGGSYPADPQRTQDGLGDGSVVVMHTAELPEGTYALKLEAYDNVLYSKKTIECEFTVDLTPPGMPTVTSSLYKPIESLPNGAGGIGVTGTFNFAVGDPDVVAFKVCLKDPDCDNGVTVKAGSDGSGTALVTPTEIARQLLYVRAVDKAGNVTSYENLAVYEFSVKDTETSPVATWTWEERDGARILDTVEPGSAPGPTLEPHGTPQIADGHVTFDSGALGTATTGYLVPGQKVLDTSKSFTIAAWARLESTSAHQTVVSIAGGNRPGVYLKYNVTRGKWTFEMPDADVASPSWYIVASTNAPVLGRWTHLAGVYDQASKKMTLYVDGSAQGSLSRDKTFSSPGPFWVGQAADTTGRIWSPFLGGVDDVQAWNRVVMESQIKKDAAWPTTIGRWKMDAGSGSDSSGFDHAVALSSGVTATADQKALSFAGTGCAQTSGPILTSKGSFSAAVWVRLTDKSANRTILAQSGSTRSALSLVYQADADRWRFLMTSADTTSAASTPIDSKASPMIGQWTHLAIVYDATTSTMRLYVNAELAGTKTHASAWNAPGNLRLGCSGLAAGEDWRGDLDDVWTFAGVLGGDDVKSHVATVKATMDASGRVPGKSSTPRPAQEFISLDFTEGGSAVINALHYDEYADAWDERALWTPSESRFYPGTTVMRTGYIDDNRILDAVILHEDHVFEMRPGWTHSIITRRTVTMTVLLGTEDGFETRDVNPMALETVTGTAENPTAPVGAWYPANTPLSIGDIDADGDGDLVATADGRSCTGGPRVFSNVDGNLTGPYSMPVGAIDWCLTFTAQPKLTDLNGDGADDLVVMASPAAGAGVRLAVHRAVGEGTLREPTLAWTWAGTDWNAAGLKAIASDFTADGASDFATLRRRSDGTWAFEVFATVTGTTAVVGPVLKASPTTPDQFAYATPAAVDVDRDGDADLLVKYSDGVDSSAWVYTNNGGTFSSEQRLWPALE